jgi:hypothetical protein
MAGFIYGWAGGDTVETYNEDDAQHPKDAEKKGEWNYM